jgi:hypothetical protein
MTLCFLGVIQMEKGLLDVYLFVGGWAALYFGIALIILINRWDRKRKVHN